MNQCPRSLLNQGAGAGEARVLKCSLRAGGVLFAEGGFGAITRRSDSVWLASGIRQSHSAAARDNSRATRVFPNGMTVTAR